MCGEHPRAASNSASRSGSSPRVWGALGQIRKAQQAARLIPTCVGSTTTGARNLRGRPAHPHVCGEHKRLMRRVPALSGSSPRVWGALEIAIGRLVPDRLIPTCVGSTSLAQTSAAKTSAHPHVCGEHQVLQPRFNRDLGSSPRVWGALTLVNDPRKVLRLIPTCVGSTLELFPTSDAPSAHPHVCGEHARIVSDIRCSFGSSPRVWGALLSIVRIPDVLRLIPTCVGSTLADMGFYPHTPSFRISLEPKASINPTRFLGLSPSGSAPIPASFAPPFSWP